MPTSSSPYPKLKSFNLTDRQRQVLSAIAGDVHTKEIAHTLGITEKAVAYHWSKIKVKLGVQSKLGAALFVHKNGIK